MAGKLKRLILELTGSDLTLLQQVHHGLSETPLDDFFQILDLDEALAFEAGSWVIRNERSKEFGRLFLGKSIYSAAGLYGIFNYILISRHGTERLTKARGDARIPEDLVHLNQELNLNFRNQKASLAHRLSTVSPEAETQLVSRLTLPTKHYAWEYNLRRSQEVGDSVTPFRASNTPTGEERVEGYARLIANTVNGYLELYKEEKSGLDLVGTARS